MTLGHSKPRQQVEAGDVGICFHADLWVCGVGDDLLLLGGFDTAGLADVLELIFGLFGDCDAL